MKESQLVKEQDIRQLQQTVTTILSRVQHEGDAALRHFEKEFDDYEPETFFVSREEAAAAQDLLPGAVVKELDFAIERVTAFAEAQRSSLSEFEREMLPGVIMGQRVVPVQSCGCYVPAGRYPCLTSAVMSVIPAKVAGVERIVVCSPPGRENRINPGILYTLYKMEVPEILCVGGAQAIGALAFGTQTLQPVDLIVGPGNQYVAEAKRQVFGQVGIDFIAGPSECLVIADDTAKAELVAADLLAQAEHDPNARCALVTTSRAIAESALDEVERQLRDRTTEVVARASWETNGEVALVETIEDAVRFANEWAPEHLEVHTMEPTVLLPLLHNYGSLFLGEQTAEVYADKVAGTNHILPTGGTARYTGGLWVGNYLKVITHQMVETGASLMLAKLAETQAAYEGMDAHRFAATIRLELLAAS
ncbi:histidinol dehydrogenase [Candidatus Cryosericum septentrionale]|uniref:Histidinol dehydrogenase n=2 Tax=Candidatus Cryosericum septentrionale TaxID=2290913 RepID=A0A398DX38_9BACT|nr:histidinol dehydrogenase [Candidatus Cryosericum septentrionale]